MATHNRPCPAVERQTLSLPRTRGRSYGGNGGTARQLFLLCRLFLPGGGRQGITGGSTIERRCSRPRVIPPVGISIHERWLATGASSHGRRLRVRRHGGGRLLRLIRSLKLCCPRPASWSTNLQRYNTFRQPGLRPACQKVVHAYREIAARASPSPHRFASPHIATSTRLVEFPLNMACPPPRRFCKSLPARWIQDRDKFSVAKRRFQPSRHPH